MGSFSNVFRFPNPWGQSWVQAFSPPATSGEFGTGRREHAIDVEWPSETDKAPKIWRARRIPAEQGWQLGPIEDARPQED